MSDIFILSFNKKLKDVPLSQDDLQLYISGHETACFDIQEAKCFPTAAAAEAYNQTSGNAFFAPVAFSRYELFRKNEDKARSKVDL